MDPELRGKQGLVTGGSMGIGRAVPLGLTREGVRMAICAQGKAALEETGAEIRRVGREVHAISADCTRPAEVVSSRGGGVRALGGLDILVNSVGGAKSGAFLALGEADWAESLESKLMGQIRLTGKALPHLEAHGGCIINMSGHKQPTRRPSRRGGRTRDSSTSWWASPTTCEDGLPVPGGCPAMVPEDLNLAAHGLAGHRSGSQDFLVDKPFVMR